MEENLINEIKEIINQQTKNSRKMIYVRTRDLQKLGALVDSKDERVYIEVNTLMGLLNDYKGLER